MVRYHEDSESLESPAKGRKISSPSGPESVCASPFGPPQLTQKNGLDAVEMKALEASINQQHLLDSSFIVQPSSQSRKLKLVAPNDGYISDITKFIPAGCIRIYSDESIVLENRIFNSCQSWQAFMHPRDIYHIDGASWIPNDIQEQLLNSPYLSQFRTLFIAGWIRMEFKATDQASGQVRVYILPDDVGRASIDREVTSLRKAMRLLIPQLDMNKDTWSGLWTGLTPVIHVDSSLDANHKSESISLFQLFNSLPSPNPDPLLVKDKYVREVMYSLLEGYVPGLNPDTKMHQYQCRSSALMLQRETQPTQILDPRLRALKDQNGSTWYCQSGSSLCLREPRFYEAPRGGICAENMGLGKTLICLALILATRHLSSTVPVQYSLRSVSVARRSARSLMAMAAATIGRSGTPWHGQLHQKETYEGYEFTRVREALKQEAGYYWIPSSEPRRSRNLRSMPPQKVLLTNATLVVVPSNLVTQWEHEIQKHTPDLKVFIANVGTKLPPAERLADYELILFNKTRFEQEAKDEARSVPAPTFDEPQGIRKDFHYVLHGSPLKGLHFKRIITDEGHTFGNSSNSSKTDIVVALDSLHLDARWIISGTPTKGLYGIDVSSISDTLPNEKIRDTSSGSGNAVPNIASDEETRFYQEERKNLEKLGNIAMVYLKAQPWANPADDSASWSKLIMQPRHGRKSHGDPKILQSTLEGMIIRHTASDIAQEITLSPLMKKFVYIEGSFQDKLALNMFSMSIIANAITSERKDADYLFHPMQRAALQRLVNNLRQASFHWSGYTSEMIRDTISVSKKFLEEGKIDVTPRDENLLRRAIRMGEMALSNNIFLNASELHQMAMYVQNDFPKAALSSWALDSDEGTPTLMGASMILDVQQHWYPDDFNPYQTFFSRGRFVMEKARATSDATRTSGRTRQPTLAGGVRVEASPEKSSDSGPLGSKSHTSTLRTKLGKGKGKGPKVQFSFDRRRLAQQENFNRANVERAKKFFALSWGEFEVFSSPLALQYFDDCFTASFKAARIISTASAKLSYLMDQVYAYHETEKIIIFYESQNVGFYIGEALELLNIQHLIYAKGISSELRSKYVVEFNQTDKFRVLLMDVNDAAFGLDMSSATRVYFVNPVFSPHIEAQAIKRAHRIGQLRPVHVEILVLKGSIEEAILGCRDKMSNEEHIRLKSILDNDSMYDWIKNVPFLDLPENTEGEKQMAKLAYQHPAFKVANNTADTGPKSRSAHKIDNMKEVFASYTTNMNKTIRRFAQRNVTRDVDARSLLDRIRSLPANIRALIGRHVIRDPDVDMSDSMTRQQYQIYLMRKVSADLRTKTPTILANDENEIVAFSSLKLNSAGVSENLAGETLDQAVKLDFQDGHHTPASTSSTNHQNANSSFPQPLDFGQRILVGDHYPLPIGSDRSPFLMPNENGEGRALRGVLDELGDEEMQDATLQ